MSLRKKVIDLLLKQESPCDFSFGDLVAKVLFCDGEMALLIDGTQKNCRVFYNSKIGVKDSFLRLTDVLGVINTLDNKGLVFISDSYQSDGLELYYETKEDFHETHIPGEYSICDKQKLVLSEKDQSIIGDCIMNSVVLPERMNASIVHIFCSRIYPTKGLEEYVKRGYRTWEEQSARCSHIISWIAIGVSIVIGLLSYV